MKITNPKLPAALVSGKEVNVVLPSGKQIPGTFQVDEVENDGFKCQILLPAAAAGTPSIMRGLKLDQQAFEEIKAIGAEFKLRIKTNADLNRLMALSTPPNFTLE
jgi:hypothetical protein